MPIYAPINIPPGLWDNGTEYQSQGRWRDGNLVRWRNGAMFPVGGWSLYGDDGFAGVARGCIAWTDNSGNRWVAWGTADYAYAMDDDGAITDITPTLTAGSESANFTGGYGDGDYGEGTYGTPRPDTGILTLATTWAWDTFGEIPVGCSDADGTLWEWDLNTANNLTAITNAPTGCVGLVVTAERFIFALGDGGDPRSIRWCDREGRTTWTSAVTNQAGGRDLKTNGEIMFGLQARGETVIVTSVDAWRARYIGYPDVYSFERVGGGCGAPGRRTGVRLDTGIVWLGFNGFFMYEGGYVRRLPCAVWDFFQEDLSRVQASKVFGWLNHQHDEVWWLYPSDTSNECDSYIAWNYVENFWHYGHMPASSMVQQGTFSTPIGLHTPSVTDLITNGDFALGTDWTLGTNWQITGGVANQTAPTASNLEQTLTLTEGSEYTVTFTVASRTAGSVTMSLGGTAGTARSTNATFTEVITAAAGSLISFAADGTWDGSIDDVTVYASGNVYQHETGYVHGSETPYAESGPFELTRGDRRMHVTHLIPDEDTLGSVTATFKTREYPTASETTHGPYTLTEPTSVRFSGRQTVIRVEPGGESDWRFGIPRLEMTTGGRR